MPFQSEKQRRYLWANEPEIARDWTDTYGSGIHKALGGRIGFYTGGQPYLPGLEPINTMNNPTWNPITNEFEYNMGNRAENLILPGMENMPSGYPWSMQGEGASPNSWMTDKRYVSVPEGMRETISDASFSTETPPEGIASDYLGSRNPIPRSGISNLISGYDPAFGEVETWNSFNTGYPSGYFNKHSSYDWEGEHPQMIRYDEPGRFELSEEGEPTGINQLPNDFNRDYQPEDANWRTRLRNKGSGIKRALASGLGRVIDFPMGIMSAMAQGFPNNAQEQAMVDLYGGNTVTEGPMAGYNAASMFGKGLPAATQKRISKREETLQKMANWEQWRKDRFKQKTGILKAELAKQQRALLNQANQVKTTYHRDEAARQGGQNPSAQSFRSAPGGLSQAQSRAARGDPQGTGGGWKW
jgi:hypothetical protein